MVGGIRVVDFDRLRARQSGAAPVDPMEIFRRLPKSAGINDLYSSQATVLKDWYSDRSRADTIVKLHTGGGKTLVGLLIAQSSLNEMGRPVVYLVANKQLVDQTIGKAEQYGIEAVAFKSGEPLSKRFLNASAVMVGSYSALFNGLSRFGIRGGRESLDVGTVILDDAHAAFQVVRDAFTLAVSSSADRARYEALVSTFRQSFRDIDRIGTLEDLISGSSRGVLEVPYWAWLEHLDVVRAHLADAVEEYKFQWPLIRDELHTCHALISPYSFSITPVVPGMHLFPSFCDAPRRVYMSATIADDSEIVRTFDADPLAAKEPLTSESLAGVSERMILIPENMPLGVSNLDAVKDLAKEVAGAGLGVVILVPSDRDAEDWADIAQVAKGSDEAADLVARLQNHETYGPVVFANRYDGIDLPGKSCRLLVLSGLPVGTSDYEQYRATAMFGSATTARMLAQRIEQGAGRGSRGSSDHCVVILTRADLTGWIGRRANFRFFTTPTRAQLDLGDEVTREISSLEELTDTVQKCLGRDPGWMSYHAEKLADLVHDDESDDARIEQAATERRATRLWRDGYHERAIALLRRYEDDREVDGQTKGWMGQLAARIAYDWPNRELADELQRRAYSENRNLIRPLTRPAHRPLSVPGQQAKSIVAKVTEYHFRSAMEQDFERNASFLTPDATAPQFEEALKNLGLYVGFSAERKDINGGGPDVLWLLPEREALIIEAKSRKEGRPLTKNEHGQLLEAAEWFETEYPEYKGLRVSVHPNNLATANAHAARSFALTMDKLSQLVVDTRKLLRSLWESQADEDSLLAECSRLLDESPIKHSRIADEYLQPFAGQSPQG